MIHIHVYTILKVKNIFLSNCLKQLPIFTMCLSKKSKHQLKKEQLLRNANISKQCQSRWRPCHVANNVDNERIIPGCENAPSKKSKEQDCAFCVLKTHPHVLRQSPELWTYNIIRVYNILVIFAISYHINSQQGQRNKKIWGIPSGGMFI